MDAANPGETVAAYDLSPAGTQFASPLEMSTSIAMPASGEQKAGLLPLVITTGDGGYEAPAEETSAIDQGAATATVDASIAHFSEAWVNYSPLKATIDDPTDQPVGIAFVVNAFTDVALFGAPWRLADGSDLVVDPEAFQFYKITWTAGSYLTPATIDAHPETAWGAGYNAEFTCSTLGATWVQFSGQMAWSGKLKEYKPSNPDYGSYNQDPYIQGGTPDRAVVVRDSVLNFSVKSKPFNCKAAPPATPTKKPTPSPTASPQVVTTLPEGHISGMCWRYNAGPPPGLLFTLYWYGFDTTSMIITLDNSNGGTPSSLPFNADGPGFVEIPFAVDGPGPITIKQVLVEKPDGSKVDITKPFTDFLKTDTLDPTKNKAWGSIC